MVLAWYWYGYGIFVGMVFADPQTARRDCPPRIPGAPRKNNPNFAPMGMLVSPGLFSGLNFRGLKDWVVFRHTLYGIGAVLVWCIYGVGMLLVGYWYGIGMV